MDKRGAREAPGEEPGRSAELARDSVLPSVPLTPAWAVPGVDRPSPLSEALAQIRSGISAARGGATVLRDIDCRDGVRDVDALLAELESFWLELVADLDGRPGAVPGVRAGSTALTFLTAGLNRSYSQAKKDVAAAKAIARPEGFSLAPTESEPAENEPPGSDSGRASLALMGAAFAAGQVTRAHFDVVVRCVEGIPGRVLDAVDETGASGRDRVDRYLSEQSRNFDPIRVARLAKELRAVLDPDKVDKFDPEDYLRRKLSLGEGSDGMTVGNFQLDPAGAVWVRTAMAHFAAPGKATRPDAGGEQSAEQAESSGQQKMDTSGLRDERTQGHRYADALVEICRLAMDADQAQTRREPPHVLVITTAEQLADARNRQRTTKAGRRRSTNAESRSGAAMSPGLADAAHAGSLSPATLARLTCDAILQAVVLDSRSGAVLDLGRTQRTASLAQRKALSARDRGCIFPGCHAPPGRCDAHHVKPWSLGGLTDIGGLALLCEGHHTMVHLGIWTIVMVEGVPHIDPPSWHKLAGSGPLRNRLHDAVQQARRLAQQLRLDVDEGGAGESGAGPPGMAA